MDRSNLIVNYLPSAFSEQELRAMFEPFGSIDSVKIVRDKATGISMGFGFVNFANNESAIAAVANLNGKQMTEGKKMKVSVARPAWKANIHSNLYVSGLPLNFSEAEVTALFGQCSCKIENLRLLRDQQGRFRGIAVVRFDTEEAAYEVMKEFNGLTLQGSSSPIHIKPWRPEFRAERVDREVMARHMAKQATESSMAQLSRLSVDSGLGFPSQLQGLRPLSPAPSFGRMGGFMMPEQGVGQMDPQTVAMMAAAQTYSNMAGMGQNQLNLSGNLGLGSLSQNPLQGLTHLSGLSMGLQNLQAHTLGQGQGQAPAFTNPSPAPQLSLSRPEASPLNLSRESQAASDDQGPFALFVFHLPPEADDATLRVLFEPYGPLESAKVVAGRGYGFVNFERFEDARLAVQQLNGFRLGSKFLKVEFKKQSTPASASSSSNPPSFGLQNSPSYPFHLSQGSLYAPELGGQSSGPLASQPALSLATEDRTPVAAGLGYASPQY